MNQDSDPPPADAQLDAGDLHLTLVAQLRAHMAEALGLDEPPAIIADGEFHSYRVPGTSSVLRYSATVLRAGFVLVGPDGHAVAGGLWGASEYGPVFVSLFQSIVDEQVQTAQERQRDTEAVLLEYLRQRGAELDAARAKGEPSPAWARRSLRGRRSQ